MFKKIKFTDFMLLDLRESPWHMISPIRNGKQGFKLECLHFPKTPFDDSILSSSVSTCMSVLSQFGNSIIYGTHVARRNSANTPRCDFSSCGQSQTIKCENKMWIKFTISFGEDGRVLERRILENWAKIGILGLEEVISQEQACKESSEQQRKPCWTSS